MKKVFITITLLIIILSNMATSCMAVQGIDPDGFKPGIAVDTDLAGRLSDVIRIVQVVGTGIVAIACVIMGIRYVMSSVEDRADIKKKLIPYVIGAGIFFGATGILQIIQQVATWFPTE